MLVIESYRQGKLSRGQAAEMLGLGFHEAEILLNRYGANQQPTWDELEQIPVGTLNLIELADEQGLLDGIAALNELRQTTFRAAPELLGRFEERMKARQD